MKYWGQLLQPFAMCDPSLSLCLDVCIWAHAWARIHICFYLFVNPPHEEMSLYHKNTPQFSACLSVPVLSRWTLKYYWLSLLSLLFNQTISQWMLSLQRAKSESGRVCMYIHVWDTEIQSSKSGPNNPESGIWTLLASLLYMFIIWYLPVGGKAWDRHKPHL